MPITKQQLQQEMHIAGFPFAKRAKAFDIAWAGITLYREYKVRRYRSHTEKLIKKPTKVHSTKSGRYNQTGPRTILISALCRAWLYGFDKKSTLNNKRNTGSVFEKFASSVMVREGIGKPFQHLERHWSIRKKIWNQNQKWRVSGGTFP